METSNSTLIRFVRSALVVGALLHPASSLQAGQELAVKIAPEVALPPATIHVRAEIPRDAANRALEIVADSPDFYRSSRFPLDGDRAEREISLELKNLPSGNYHVTATLTTANGRRVVVAQSFKVADFD